MHFFSVCSSCILPHILFTLYFSLNYFAGQRDFGETIFGFAIHACKRVL